jgi:hypothetical protein
MSSTLNLRRRELSVEEYVRREEEKFASRERGHEFKEKSLFWANARRAGREDFLKGLIAAVKRRRQLQSRKAGAAQMRRPSPF